jgi:hypothetical protein
VVLQADYHYQTAYKTNCPFLTEMGNPTFPFPVSRKSILALLQTNSTNFAQG